MISKLNVLSLDQVLAERSRVITVNNRLAKHLRTTSDRQLGESGQLVWPSIDDERGRWILSPHAQQATEFTLTEWNGSSGERYVNNRTLVDDQGQRWIIGYKTSSPDTDDVAAFYAQEQEKYRQPLEAYARLLRQTEARPIRLGLYFPLLPGWLEWSPEG